MFGDTPDALVSGAREAVEAGLEPDAALRALTLSAAEIFGLDDMVGSVEEGKIANLTVTRGGALRRRRFSRDGLRRWGEVPAE